MPRDLAESEMIKKTVDLCRANTQNTTVKSVLVSTKFDNPKDVVARFIIECNKTQQEAQILTLRQFQNRNSRGRIHSNYNRPRGRNFQNHHTQGDYEHENARFENCDNLDYYHSHRF